MKRALALLTLVLPALAFAQTKPAPSLFEIATTDLQARAAYAHAQVDIAAKHIVLHPPASRPALKTRDGRIAPDPRPTPQQSVDEGKKAVKDVDRMVSNVLANLKALPIATEKDRKEFAAALTLARLQVNEQIDLVLRALAETEYIAPRPSWLGPAPVQVSAAANAQLDKDLSDVVFTAWQDAHPDNTGGFGVVGVGGKESMHAFNAGESVGTIAKAITHRVTFRINPAMGKKSMTPTTMNFTLQLLAPMTIGGVQQREGSLLVRRATLWYTQGQPADIAASLAPTTATAPATKPGK